MKPLTLVELAHQRPELSADRDLIDRLSSFPIPDPTLQRIYLQLLRRDERAHAA
jgi:hypothetical protein